MIDEDGPDLAEDFYQGTERYNWVDRLHNFIPNLRLLSIALPLIPSAIFTSFASKVAAGSSVGTSLVVFSDCNDKTVTILTVTFCQ